MMILTATHGRILSALVVAAAMAAFFAQATAVRAADDLTCNGCVNSKELKNNGIRSRDIRNGQVKAADLAKGAVTGAKVRNGSLTAADLAPGVVFGETVLVRANGGSALANCDNLRTALAEIVDAGPENPVVVKLERGAYDCGNTPLALVPHVAIEGAGRGATTIVGNVNSDPLDLGVISGADNAALRHLTVEHRGDVSDGAVVISTLGSDMRITDVAVKVDSSMANGVLGIFAEGGSLGLSHVSVQTECPGVALGIEGTSGARLNMINTWVHNQGGAGSPTALSLIDSFVTGFGVLFSSGLRGSGNSVFVLVDGTVIGPRSAGGTFTCVGIADGDFMPRDLDCRR